MILSQLLDVFHQQKILQHHLCNFSSSLSVFTHDDNKTATQLIIGFADTAAAQYARASSIIQTMIGAQGDELVLLLDDQFQSDINTYQQMYLVQIQLLQSIQTHPAIHILEDWRETSIFSHRSL